MVPTVAKLDRRLKGPDSEAPTQRQRILPSAGGMGIMALVILDGTSILP
jgi:hypothetical protein